MTLQDTLRLGPLNLPVRYLVFVGAAAVGYLTMSVLLARRPVLRRSTGNRFVNALVTFLVVWKLEPPVALLVGGFFHGNLDWSTVALQIFVPGGTLASSLGLAAAAVYLAASIFHRRSEERPLPALLSLTATLAPAVVAYLVAAAILTPPLPLGGAAAEQRQTAVIGTSVGDRAPSFRATTLTGQQIAFNGRAGKTIVLNFWATWCPPCRAELPDLVHFSSVPQNSRIEVWAVDMTGTEPSLAAVQSFATEHGIRFPVLTDPTGSIARAFRVSAVPTTFIISPDGIIRAKQVGAMSPSWLRRQTAHP